MKPPTLARLFQLLSEPGNHSDTDIARNLDLDVGVLRNRLNDLKARGILSGPVLERGVESWKSWFPTPLASAEALGRSGLAATLPVALQPSFFRRIWT